MMDARAHARMVRAATPPAVATVEGRVRLTVTQSRVLWTIRYTSRDTHWKHPTLNTLERLGLAVSVNLRRPDGHLSSLRRWSITDAGIAALAPPA